MSFFVVVIYLVVTLNQVFFKNIPVFGYIDEILPLLLLVLGVIRYCLRPQSFPKKIGKSLFFSCVFFLIFMFYGMICSVYSDIKMPLIVVVKDILLISKFFLSYVGSRLLFYNINMNHIFKTKIVPLTKMIVTIIFACGVISLFVNIGMTSGSIRFGLPAYRFLYAHYTFLVAGCLLFLSTLTYDLKRTNYKYIVMTILSMLLTLRSKAVMVVSIYIFVYISLLFYRRIKKRYLVSGAFLAFFLIKDKVLLYIQWGASSLRNLLYMTGFQIANSYFPLGSGFGTFGSGISLEYFSPLYSTYGILGTYALATTPVTDVFWPYIFVQWGWIGLGLFLFALFFLFKSHYREAVTLYDKAILLTIWAYIFIASFGEAYLTNDTGVYVMIYLGMIVNSFSKKEKLIT